MEFFPKLFSSSYFCFMFFSLSLFSTINFLKCSGYFILKFVDILLCSVLQYVVT